MQNNLKTPTLIMLANLKEAIIMGTLITGVVVIGIVGLIIRKMIHDKKNGKSIQCGCDCKNCGGHCH